MQLAAPESREELMAVRLEHFLRIIVSSIARSTKKPHIEHRPNEALFRLAVNPKDQGRFVGKNGTTIWSIQTLFWFAGLAQFGYCYSVKLLDPEKEDRRPLPFKFSPKWSRKIINGLITEIIGACIPEHADYKLQELGDTHAFVKLRLPKYLQMQMEDPSFPEAFINIMRSAGMSQGVSIKTEVYFG